MSRNAGKLKPYAFNFGVSNGRDNQMPLKGLLVKHQKLHLYLPCSSMFPTLPEGNIEYFFLFENRIVESKKKLSKK